jgi:hypothetical protein
VEDIGRRKCRDFTSPQHDIGGCIQAAVFEQAHKVFVGECSNEDSKMTDVR